MKKTLEQQLLEARKEVFRITKELAQIKTKQSLPKLKRKYEGRFWKFQNSYDSDRKWWLYSYCIEVINETTGLFHTFESEIDINVFNARIERSYNICQIEISQQEYLNALDAFRQKLSTLIIDFIDIKQILPYMLNYPECVVKTNLGNEIKCYYSHERGIFDTETSELGWKSNGEENIELVTHWKLV